MARVFLDANIVIDLVENRPKSKITSEDLDGHDVFISPLSAHILLYITKRKVPYAKLEQAIDSFSIVDFSRSICDKALIGPTADFEDNVQLHSAAHADCDLFLTNDAKLLNLRFFGRCKIAPGL